MRRSWLCITAHDAALVPKDAPTLEMELLMWLMALQMDDLSALYMSQYVRVAYQYLSRYQASRASLERTMVSSIA